MSERSKLSFFFDYASPFAYLGATRVEAVAKDHGAELIWCPMLLGGLFRAIGTPNVPLFEMPEVKQRYQRADMQRWADHYGEPFAFPSRFPMNTVRALRMSLQLDNAAMSGLAHAIFRAYWADDRDINDEAELRAIADDAGFDGAALLEGCADPEVKGKLRAATEHAQAVGVCGAPSFLVQTSDDDEGVLFWGQDRLMFVGKALKGWRPAHG
jgi:2-hydroxychromene-2-carboxylate isomerase